MNIAHLHLILCHVPVIGMAFAMLLNIWGMLKKSTDIKSAALILYALSALVSVIVYFTGEGAEQIVKTIPGITEELVEPHEQTALFFFIGLAIIGTLAIAGLILAKRSQTLFNKIVFIVFVLALANSFFAIKTSFSGGLIKHNEIEFKTDTLHLVPDND